MIATAVGAVVVAAAGGAMAIYFRARAVRDRLALRLAEAREIAFVEAARRLAEAAGTSVEAVREEIERAVRLIAPGLDAVLFFEENEAQLICVAAGGSRMAYYGGLRVALDDDASLLVRALRAGHRVIARPADGAVPLHPRDAFAAAIPLILETGRRSVLYLGGADGAIDSVTDRIVRLVDQATPAYRIAFERADDRARAEYDGLTGLLGARAFRRRFAQLVDRVRADRLGRLAILFVDTDRFKTWNDTYGHASGDALLRELAQLLRAAASDPADLVARNGGDEFCLVFVDCEKSRAIERAERLRASVSGADFTSLQPVGVAAEVRISASIGVACFPVDAHSPEALLEKADEAMYHSKKTGRDGVSFFGVDTALVRGDGAIDERSADRRREC